MIVLWIAVSSLVFLLVLLDLFALRSRRSNWLRGLTPVQRSAAHGLGYVTVAMLLCLPIYFAYEHQLMGAGVKDSYTESLAGHEATLQYISCFILELALSLDSIFVLAAVFAHFKVREELQPRLLLWGMLIALAFRAGVILLIGQITFSFGWFRFVLAAGLVIAALRMILIRKENLDPDKNVLIRLARKVTPLDDRPESNDPVQIGRGVTLVTSLVVPILMIETADVFMALDSIPASFAFTREPLLIFAGSAMAVLCIRTLAPVFVQVIPRLRYFKIGLAMVLAYCAIIIALPASTIIAQLHTDGWQLTTLQKLAFVGGALAFGATIAAMFGAGSTALPENAGVSPLGQDADRLARATLAKIRKVTIFVIGMTGLIVGFVMAIGPGPGIPVLLFALVLLASEFVWARVLVNKYKGRAENVANLAAAQARKRFSPWAMAGIFAITLLIGLVIHLYGHLLINMVWALVSSKHGLFKHRIPIGLVIGAMIPMLFGQIFLAYIAFVRKPLIAQESGVPPTPMPPPPATVTAPQGTGDNV